MNRATDEAKKKRYVVAYPVPGGSGYFEVTDTKKNFTLVTIWKDLPSHVSAQDEAERLCDRLNGDER